MNDYLYDQAVLQLQQNPHLGKGLLARHLGVKTPTARRLIERYRGETTGHSQAPDYLQVRQHKLAHPEWSAATISAASGLTRDKVRLHLARLLGAQAFTGPAAPVASGVTSPFAVKGCQPGSLAGHRVESLMAGLLDAFKQAAPVNAPVILPPAGNGLLEISILDLHLGKLCWGPEVGTPYDLAIAQHTFHTALEDLLAKGSLFKPARILLPIGNDFFNVDGLNRCTTKGTPQDEDSRWQASFITGRRLMVEAIERCRQLAPVDVVMVSGNHDTQRLFYLGVVLSAWFRTTSGVTVNNEPTQRKYYSWGKNLIGFTHGDREPHASLPSIMPAEQPQAWANSTFREWHLGHWHSRQKKVFLPVTDQQGVIVRVIPSLSPADAWHKSMGYQGRRAAEAFYFDPAAGCVAEFIHSIP